MNNSDCVKKILDAIYAVDIFDNGDLSINLDYNHNDDCIEIENFWSERERNKGYGTRGFQAVLDIIDEYGFDIKLEVHPLRYQLHINEYEKSELDRLSKLNNQALNSEQLRKWYQKFGFEISHDAANIMVRKSPACKSDFSLK